MTALAATSHEGHGGLYVTHPQKSGGSTLGVWYLQRKTIEFIGQHDLATETAARFSFGGHEA